jgi:hypothetical protein
MTAHRRLVSADTAIFVPRKSALASLRRFALPFNALRLSQGDRRD